MTKHRSAGGASLLLPMSSSQELKVSKVRSVSASNLGCLSLQEGWFYKMEKVEEVPTQAAYIAFSLILALLWTHVCFLVPQKHIFTQTISHCSSYPQVNHILQSYITVVRLGYFRWECGTGTYLTFSLTLQTLLSENHHPFHSYLLWFIMMAISTILSNQVIKALIFFDVMQFKVM